VVSDATIPPAWSPGVALAGMVSVNGTIDRPRPGTVTFSWSTFTHAPTSTGFLPAASRSKPPARGLNASLAYTRRGNGPSLALETWVGPVTAAPGVAPYVKTGRLSGPFAPDGRMPNVARCDPDAEPAAGADCDGCGDGGLGGAATAGTPGASVSTAA